MSLASVASILEALRANAPLVHNITNHVVMQISANALLAAGASPLMSHEPEEFEELLGFASALVLNIGTLDIHRIQAMHKAGSIAKTKGRVVVLDPVGAGASRLRTQTSLDLMPYATVIRGNASEIMAVASACDLRQEKAAGKGVDSLHSSQQALAAAMALSQHNNCVVSVSGEEDFIIYKDQVARVQGGCAWMPKVTGTGCSATALTAAHVAAARIIGESDFMGAVSAMCHMAEAGWQCRECQGPGSFLSAFLDALYSTDPKAAAQRANMENIA